MYKLLFLGGGGIICDLNFFSYLKIFFKFSKVDMYYFYNQKDVE